MLIKDFTPFQRERKKKQNIHLRLIKEEKKGEEKSREKERRGEGEQRVKYFKRI